MIEEAHTANQTNGTTVFITPQPAQTQKQLLPMNRPFTIRLDTTLADLYRECDIPGPFIATMYCVFGHMDLHQNFPRELTYPEDEEPVPYANNEKEIARLRKIILGLKPLRRAFGLGNVDVLFFRTSLRQGWRGRCCSWNRINSIDPEC